MPIRPENRNRYPADWREIRARILARAGDRCEWCGVENGAVGVRERDGSFHETAGMESEVAVLDGDRVIRIVLTIAHLDHQPENNDPANLAALCQMHHNRHDAAHRRRNASATLAAKRAAGCGRLAL